ncbi:Protein of unknown function [Dethiosulfatibacter aminovorans DSM 17477]|uniref:Niacin transporter n=1 Tax=Dethiosulfatibacter aminovorans DSM 17477 TaxID=1121476 RepID=A0A1M6ITP1_9FIRM|nr:ECF transporter S component [Dethiosulfatibacter aminovorans]SHJ37798.1 Protein of unknown function [Dethiosulfatibacter aminovorans DSM 17477]
MRNSRTRETVLAGLFIAIGVMLPIAFHAVGAGGPIFLPMHIPVLMAGFVLSPVFALIVGMITPLLSSVLTGMPVFMPMAFIMMVELGVYGLVVSLLSKRLNTIFTLLTAMIAGRIAAGMMVMILVNVVGIKFAPPLVYLKGAVITGIPGIVVQLIFIPALLVLVKRSNPKLTANH